MALSNLITTLPVGRPQQVTPAPTAQQGGHIAPQGAPQYATYQPTAGLAAQLSGLTRQPVGPTGVDMVSNSLAAFLDPNSRYIQDARQRGMEVAAQRGGINSSIAAGAAERSAISAAAPLAQAALGVETNRESVAMQDWLDNQQFNRNLQGQMAMFPLQQGASMLNMVQQFALQDPALFTPEVISGYSNFFNENMKNIMRQYFPGRT